MLLYIAGPMTGMRDHNFPAFFRAEALLNAAGYDTCNPARLEGDLDITWTKALERDIPHLVACDGVALLPNWWLSKGAKFEYRIMTTLEKPCRDLTDWIRRAA